MGADQMKLGPRQEAVAFRIWAYAHRHGWNVTAQQIADATGFSRSYVNGIISSKGWTGRLAGCDEITRAAGRRGNAAKALRTRGRKFDENALDVVELMQWPGSQA